MEFNYNNPLEQKETKKHFIVVKGFKKTTRAKDCVI